MTTKKRTALDEVQEEEGPLEFEVTNAERKHLRNMLKAPGYVVLQKVWQAYIDAVEESAIAVSKIDPLNNKDRIATLWHGVAVAEQILENMKKGIDFEIEMLTNSEKPAPDAKTLADRRRKYASFGGFGPLPEN